MLQRHATTPSFMLPRIWALSMLESDDDFHANVLPVC